MRALALRLNLVVVLLVAMLAAGRGLQGLVHVLRGAETHVCTCATGGDHASCPVCNRALREEPRSTMPAAQGVPCGRDIGMVAVAGAEASTLPAPVAALARPFVRSPAPGLESAAERDVVLEPATPPPRRAAT
jgi:hypothetical protein